ncbi:hypothetical protein AAIP46_003414 [Yersinia ruckeri]|nr:hypothetical protein [Yersinia ruckeri]EKN3362036.1 hypothetical protein [Yersinia ruckeri]EKN4201560.1 hypothetical protein [Yersinia ruckeri]EKN4696847.1 hypothetical protein [Yersinia ruckeri]EKN4726192.1 hypothetical protein [Yersinia ruckeri]
MARAVDGLPTFKDLNLPDLRDLAAELRRKPLDEVEAAESIDDALQILEIHMGFVQAEMVSIEKSTPIGTMKIHRSNLIHIVEKRRDARERYVLLALDTIKNPFEVWESDYDDEQVRFVFIGAYSQKQQMLVIVAPWEGKVLWNFMHTESKSLNKHRRGKLLYKNYKL